MWWAPGLLKVVFVETPAARKAAEQGTLAGREHPLVLQRQ
ncbi:isocitrate dehydrogenase [Pedobacter sp. BAL39]|nr:isocitrate dehydrogenase [Pedobacter sp. BAL39]